MERLVRRAERPERRLVEVGEQATQLIGTAGVDQADHALEDVAVLRRNADGGDGSGHGGTCITSGTNVIQHPARRYRFE